MRMKKGYRNLGPEERERINLYKAEGKSLREIGRLLGRSSATISRELRRNAAPVQNLAHKAQERYQERQSEAHSRPRLKTEAIRTAVTEMLKERLSPELIAGRLPLDRVEHGGKSYLWYLRVQSGLLLGLHRLGRRIDFGNPLSLEGGRTSGRTLSRPESLLDGPI